MFLNILKKDLKRKKSMNIILFIFIVLCATFMASSVSNLSTVLNAIDYFGEKTNLADYFIISSSDEVDSWLESSPYVKDSRKDTGVIVESNNLLPENGEYDVVGTTFISTLPDKYNLLLDENNEPITTLKSGEMALSHLEASRNDLKLGDKITVDLGGREKTFTISVVMKDMLYGSQYIDTTRIIVCDKDYDYLTKADDIAFLDTYSVVTDDTKALVKDLQRQSFPTFYHCDKATLESTFTMEMMVAAILIIVSVCLIIIALVILRFTIVFTLQEDYREIGIMKAIGLKNADIKKLYIIKYFALAVTGSVVGLVISIPFGNMMTENLKNNIAMESASGNLFISIICGIIIVLLVVMFCYISASRLNKFTAIQAIRSGSTGERFNNRRFFLNRRRRIPTSLFLALNSIISAIKSYGILVITFIMGTLLVLMPLNAVNTLNSDDIVDFFTIIKTDVYIDNLRAHDYITNGSYDYMMEDLEKLRQLYKENDADVEFNVETIYSAKVYVNDPEEVTSIISFKSEVFDCSALNSFVDGTPPKLPNEIAVTELLLKDFDVVIGDSITIIVGDTERSYLITASFQSMNNMGKTILFSSQADFNLNYAGSVIIQGNFVNREDINGQIEKLKEATPQYAIKDAKEYVSMYIGGIADTIDAMKTLILGVVLFINCLITVLLMRTFITREAGEIALLKNIGFTNAFIALWQALRIILTLFVSVILGVLLSNPMNAVMAKFTFGLMGAHKMPITINALEVYFKYPLLLFLGTCVAAIISSAAVRKVNLKEINNVE